MALAGACRERFLRAELGYSRSGAGFAAISGSDHVACRLVDGNKEVVPFADLRCAAQSGRPAGGVRGFSSAALDHVPALTCVRSIVQFVYLTGIKAFRRCSPIVLMFDGLVQMPARAVLVAAMRGQGMARQMDPDDLNPERIVTVFGGTGFLGRRIVKRLLERGFTVRAVSRHPARVALVFSPITRMPEAVEADILDTSSIGSAITGSQVIVNAVSLYVEQGVQTFERVHVKAAADLAAASRNGEVDQFVQISGIGSDPQSDSNYIRARGRGEVAVESAFPGAFIVRPAVMTGPDDAFLTTIVRMIRLLPVYPLFGDGGTRLQPVYVADVAEAVSRLIDGRTHKGSSIFEFGGPRIYTYKELLREIARQLDTHVKLMPVPFAVWNALAGVAELLPAAPITRSQIDLMRQDNVAAIDAPGLKELDVEPRDIDEVIRAIEQRRGAGSHSSP
ncbi:complex I NDUFA9 subunit family protein [Mesorhizobium sp. M1428]|uniref:complex I NDUFA9 subunit family protein n=1 Tax=Mesorhizobium sp. M1428 TaxID=2957102 RepID=UPI003335C7A9